MLQGVYLCSFFFFNYGNFSNVFTITVQREKKKSFCRQHTILLFIFFVLHCYIIFFYDHFISVRFFFLHVSGVLFLGSSPIQRVESFSACVYYNFSEDEGHIYVQLLSL